jgi:hypothetical protein
MKPETFDIKKACEAQTKLCKEKDYPHFAPMDGRCYECNQNIYKEGGRSIEYATTHLVTGCPWCHISYCE